MMLETLALDAELQNKSSSPVQARVGQKHTSIRSADLAESSHGKVKDLSGHKYAEEQGNNEEGGTKEGGTNRCKTDVMCYGLLEDVFGCDLFENQRNLCSCSLLTRWGSRLQTLCWDICISVG